MAPTLKNKEIIDVYKDKVDLCYDSREKDSVVGSFLSAKEVEKNQLEACDLPGSKKKSATTKNFKHEKSAIRSSFPVRSTVNSATTEEDIDMVIDKTIIITIIIDE